MNLRTLLPNASKDCIALNPSDALQGNVERKRAKYEANHNRQIPNPVSQHHQTPALDGADAGEAQCLVRTRVRFTGYRVRPLDPDNFAGSVKDLLDGLRHAHIILGDEPWCLELTTAQEKVKSYKDEKTVITIDL